MESSSITSANFSTGSGPQYNDAGVLNGFNMSKEAAAAIKKKKGFVQNFLRFRAIPLEKKKI